MIIQINIQRALIRANEFRLRRRSQPSHSTRPFPDVQHDQQIQQAQDEERPDEIIELGDQHVHERTIVIARTFHHHRRLLVLARPEHVEQPDAGGEVHCTEEIYDDRLSTIRELTEGDDPDHRHH